MAQNPPRAELQQSGSEANLFSSESVLNILKLIFAGSPLPEILSIIAQLVESQGDGLFCTIWLPEEGADYLYCAAAPGLPGFRDHAGRTKVCDKGASCGTAVYRRQPVYVTDILTEPSWDDYRHRMEPFGIRSVWSRPLFTKEGKVLGTFAILYREPHSPGALDLQLIENAAHITGIAIERHVNEQALRRERDRLSLLLETANSITSKLDLRRLIEVLSTNLLSVTRCDFCALLLPDADSGELRLTTLYNPDARGSLSDGAIVPIHGSLLGKAFWSGKTQHFDNIEQLRDDPESFGNEAGRPFYERVVAEGLISGCDLPLIGRNGVVGVLTARKRSQKAFSKEDVRFLEQIAGQVAVAVENALHYETAITDRDKEAKHRLYLEQEIGAEFGEIIGDSPALKAALHLVSVVAPTNSTVLIQGETGTGKELMARAIHNLSDRKDRTFVKLNCAAIPLGLLESERFGH
jgi:formate hydrogenlyase transcriptional activator